MLSRIFTADDQLWFSRFSGDTNPMHMDRLAARRSQPGAPVVHGVHAVLWALEQMVPLEELASLKVQFQKFIYLERVVFLSVAERKGDVRKAVISVDGQAAITITATLGPRRRGSFPMFPPSAPSLSEPTFEEMASLQGCLPATAVQGFPALSKSIGSERVGALALLSTLVGMICPGRYSVFAAFKIDLVESNRPGLGWQTIRTDERFRMLTLGVGGSIEGEITAFASIPPSGPPTLASLGARVSPDEFAGRSALVVGGSRGLGAVTATLLAAGGARVTITYASGKAEAETLSHEIGCTVLPCDVRQPVDLSTLPEITHLYYFATPRIFRQSASVFSRETFDDFRAVYIDGFLEIFQWLSEHRPSFRHAFAPSSVAVDERPEGLTEYAMAKAAAEILCEDLSVGRIRIACPRLPRILTDQTATIPPVPAADAVSVLLPLLRAE